MQCGIMRIEKRRRGAVRGLQLEANRTRAEHESGRDFAASDIDWSRTDSNIRLIHTDNWHKAITEQVRAANVRERKDSTVLLDGLYTASPDWFATHSPAEAMEYFEACLAFHAAEYCGGDSSRIINAVVHLDERTPHMQVASVPIVRDDRGAHLSAKAILGGRAEMSKHQDRFYEAVARDRGLDRGERRDAETKREHVTKREWQLAEAERKLGQAAEQLQAHQTATQELIEARRHEGKPEPIHEGKSRTGLLGSVIEGVTYSYEDAERLQRRGELAPLLKGYTDSVGKMEQLHQAMATWPDSLEAVRKADEARAYWVDRAKRYEQADARYEQLRRAYPAEIERMEQQLATRTRSHKHDRHER